MPANTNLFNQYFIEFVQKIIFAHNDKFHDEEYILGCMPEFYKDPAMVSGALNLLSMTGQIEHKNIEGKDTWKAIPKAIQDYKDNLELDQRIKLYTKENLLSQRWPLRWWWAISGLTIILSALASFLVNKLTKDAPTQPVIRTERTQQTNQLQLPPENKKDS